jgi:arginine repressor
MIAHVNMLPLRLAIPVTDKENWRFKVEHKIPMSRTSRHALINKILARGSVASQRQLRDLLAEQGVYTTQATLSRDLLELRAVKVRTPSGQSVYAVPEAGAPGQLPVAAPEEEAFDEVLTTRLSRWIQDLLVSVDQAYNQLVLRTPAGAAQLLASAMDNAMIPGVLGCIAGDDTILVIATKDEVASELRGRLLELARPTQGR